MFKFFSIVSAAKTASSYNFFCSCILIFSADIFKDNSSSRAFLFWVIFPNFIFCLNSFWDFWSSLNILSDSLISFLYNSNFVFCSRKKSSFCNSGNFLNNVTTSSSFLPISFRSDNETKIIYKLSLYLSNVSFGFIHLSTYWFLKSIMSRSTILNKTSNCGNFQSSGSSTLPGV